MTDP
jgi:4-carboxymuconolactone decarboxylase